MTLKYLRDKKVLVHYSHVHFCSPSHKNIKCYWGKLKSLLDAFAALGLRVCSCISSYHCAIWCVLFDIEADRRSREFWAFIDIGDTDLHRDGVPTGAAATQRCLILCRDLKLYTVRLLII